MLGIALRHPIPARAVIVHRVILIHGGQACTCNDRFDSYTIAIIAKPPQPLDGDLQQVVRLLILRATSGSFCIVQILKALVQGGLNKLNRDEIRCAIETK
ncbi:hypothetical protein [Rhizobium metallidurans]|uniref:hypothetical protein n=1 Tax=Rhizobium metallidurans TaxID=1265931 RepID=UPI001AED1EE0|nr:hypothetical protein [Rhizobium metallidurans]